MFTSGEGISQKHIEGTSRNEYIPVGYPDHAIVKGYYEVASFEK